MIVYFFFAANLVLTIYDKAAVRLDITISNTVSYCSGTWISQDCVVTDKDCIDASVTASQIE